jgi:hypothetical protein
LTVSQQLVLGLEALAEKEAAVNRLSASSLDAWTKPLKHEPVPNPIHEPEILPTFLLNVFKNTHPPDGPGLIYEATVDRLVCAFFQHYLPYTHQFLLQPQQTFRGLAPEQIAVMEAEWSRILTLGDNSSVREAFANRAARLNFFFSLYSAHVQLTTWTHLTTSASTSTLTPQRFPLRLEKG